MTDKTATPDTGTVTAWFAPYGTPLPQSLNEPLPDGYQRGGPINWRRFTDSLSANVQLNAFGLPARRGRSVVFDWQPDGFERITAPELGERVTAVIEGVVDGGRPSRVVLPDVEFTDSEEADVTPDGAGVWAYRYYKEPE